MTRRQVCLQHSATRGTMHAPSPRTLFPSLAQASAWDCATSQATTGKARSGSRAPMGAEGFARAARVIAQAVAAQPPCGALRLPKASRDPRKSVHKPSTVRGRLSSRRRSRAGKLAGRVGRRGRAHNSQSTCPAESSMRRGWQWEKVARALGEGSVSYSGGGERTGREERVACAVRPGRDALSVDLKGEASRRLGGIGGGGEGNHRRERGHKPHLAASNTETRGVEVGRAGHGRRYLGRTRCFR